MKKVITYGTYDLLHHGHIALLERAKQLGDYLIVGVTSDAFDKNRGKLNVRQSVVERIDAIKATGLANEIIIEEYEGQKISDIKKYDVDIFAIGSDWLGKFDYLNEYCEVVYLKRTEGVSSTELRTAQNPVVKLGIIGLENPAIRVLEESLYVSGIEVIGIYDQNQERLQDICTKYDVKPYMNLQELFHSADAVYIVQIVTEHMKLIEEALNADCHVLCESPMFISEIDAKKAFDLARKRNRVLLEAIKTLFFPGFEHLMLIVNSGLIGSIRDIEVSSSYIPDGFENIKQNKYYGAMYGWGSIVLLPIIKLLGTNYEDCIIFDYENENFSCFVRGILKYQNAIGSFKAGTGIKTEGDMIITGTNGYIYVPAPWWKTDYFEVRYEDLRATKKYFYKYDGEGFRYELLEFVKMINNKSVESYLYTQTEMLSIAKVLEQFQQGNVNKM